jgi:hypothetical protein
LHHHKMDMETYTLFILLEQYKRIKIILPST